MLLTLLPLAMTLVAAPNADGAELNDRHRFEIVAVADGIVRLDTLTGDMVHCRDDGNGLACKAIGPEAPAAGAVRPHAPPVESKDTLNEFDKALGMMERAMKSFMDIAGEKDKSCDL